MGQIGYLRDKVIYELGVAEIRESGEERLFRTEYLGIVLMEHSGAVIYPVPIGGRGLRAPHPSFNHHALSYIVCISLLWKIFAILLDMSCLSIQ